MQLPAFIADVLFVFSKFQQRLQRDSTTIIDMQKAVDNVKKKIMQLKENQLLGGWQEALNNSTVKNTDGDVILKGIKLRQTLRQPNKHHLFVSDKRDVTAVCNEISDSLVEFLHQRFSIDEVISSQLV